MKKNQTSYVLMIALFFLSGIFSWRLYFKVYSQADTISIHDFPKTIADWTSEEIPLSKTEKAILETDNAFVRRYKNSNGAEVYLFIVYSQSNRKVSHPPEICYTGAGATILNSRHDSFESQSEAGRMTIEGNMMTVEFGRQDQEVFYWFKVGDRYTSNYWKQQLLIALKSFLNQPSSSAMIRLSSDVKAGNSEGSVGAIKELAALLPPYLAQYLP